ncbi:MAG: FAD-dependent monooxygenase, partial [Pseudomonadota bacterium]
SRGGASYSGYTVFAGELQYSSPDNGEVGYKVFIGPAAYFVITDIGKGRYQWYAFLARPPDSAKNEEKPDGSVKYLKDIFDGWSPDVHAILDATAEHEIEQRDLYDRPPSSFRPWSDGPVALLGDSIHAMMPNLGQGGCQAIEDAMVIAQELNATTSRNNVPAALTRYRDRRLVRSAAVQGLSRFASDIIIRGFDTPFKVVTKPDGSVAVENANYAGIVTRMMQPILPVFFTVQFNFLYDGWKNEYAIDLKAALAIGAIGIVILALAAGAVGDAAILLPFGLESLGATEFAASLTETLANILPSFDSIL